MAPHCATTGLEEVLPRSAKRIRCRYCQAKPRQACYVEKSRRTNRVWDVTPARHYLTPVSPIGPMAIACGIRNVDCHRHQCKRTHQTWAGSTCRTQGVRTASNSSVQCRYFHNLLRNPNNVAPEPLDVFLSHCQVQGLHQGWVRRSIQLGFLRWIPDPS